MGQKINPHVIRLGGVNNWSSRWFDEKKYKETLFQDFTLRKMLMDKLKGAGVAKVELERSINSLKIIIYVSRPGIVIGRGGSGRRIAAMPRRMGAVDEQGPGAELRAAR